MLNTAYAGLLAVTGSVKRHCSRADSPPA